VVTAILLAKLAIGSTTFIKVTEPASLTETVVDFSVA
jgi:hypothetical protein